MTRRPRKRSVKARNPVAKDLRDPLFHLRLKPSKKLYMRQPKHRNRLREADFGRTPTLVPGALLGQASGC